ncbi:DUF2690 domain-containing protein [Streptomyces sp. NPDC038707]|uniref:helix-turn-helix domain-containing protein n=1 Tax=Streptomyces sp. NPDC038707 TaxID=3154329 RepID=UPI0033ED44B8
MPRWTALPDDLHPQIEEFTVGLRQLVDRSGLDITALADRTGYGTTSWERYLDGRLLAPKGAVIALAEVTGTAPGPLTTLWELAERVWSQAELRDGSTLQALRIAEGESDRKSVGKGVVKGLGLGKGLGKGTGPGLAKGAGKGLGKGAGQDPGEEPGKGSGTGGAGTAVVPAAAGPGGGPPAVPAQPSARDADTGARDGTKGGTKDGPGSAGGAGTATRKGSGTTGWAKGGGAGGRTAEGGGTADGAGKAAEGKAAGGPPRVTWPVAGGGAVTGGGSGARPADGSGRTGATGGEADKPVKNSWGVAGYRGPSQASARPGTWPGVRSDGAAATTPATPPHALNAPGTPAGPDATRALGTPPAGSTPGPARTPAGRPGPAERWSARRQQVVMFFAGLIGVLVLIAGVFWFTHHDGDGKAGNEAKPSRSAAPVSPPPGVKCAGSACTGKDAEAMGCSGDLVTTAKTATVGTTTLEVRYSKACGTAWGRITSGVPGDSVRVTAGKERQTGDITASGDTIGYTPMVAVRNPAQARACATLASGQTGCTE